MKKHKPWDNWKAAKLGVKCGFVVSLLGFLSAVFAPQSAITPYMIGEMIGVTLAFGFWFAVFSFVRNLIFR